MPEFDAPPDTPAMSFGSPDNEPMTVVAPNVTPSSDDRFHFSSLETRSNQTSTT